MFGFGISNDILNIANRIRSDVERSLDRAFTRWDVLENDPLYFDPNHTTYRMKILTDDNGHVKVKTVKKDPGHDWETHIEEYDRGYALEQQPQKQALQQESTQGQGQTQGLEGQSGQQTSTSQQQSLQEHKPSGQLSTEHMEHDIRQIANSIKKDVESSLGQFFHRWDVFDYTPMWFDPEHVSYRMKILTDNNGHVNLRTVRKEPGKPWETRIEEFYNTTRPLESSGQSKPLESGSQEKPIETRSQVKPMESGSRDKPLESRGQEIPMESKAQVNSAEQKMGASW